MFGMVLCRTVDLILSTDRSRWGTMLAHSSVTTLNELLWASLISPNGDWLDAIVFSP